MDASVSLTADTANFIAGMRQADAAQKALASSWERSVGALFRRSPFARAERAITDFALALSSGNMVSGLQMLTSRFSGFGLAASVGIGVAIGVFKKFSDQVRESGAAVSAVNRELAHPLSVQGDLGPGIAGKIEGDIKLLETLQAKRGTLGARISEMLEHPATGGGTVTPGQEREMRRFGFSSEQIGSMRQNSAENQRRRDINSAQKAQEELEKRISDLTEKRSIFEERTAQAKIRGLQGDRLGAGLLQNQLAAEQARAELIERALREAQGPGKHNVLDDFRNTFRDIKAVNDLRDASNIGSQRAAFQQATAPFQKFGIGTAANTEDFLRKKIVADPDAAGVKQMQLQADQLNLFRQKAKLDEMKDVDFRSIPMDNPGRVFQSNLRNRIAGQEQNVIDQTQRVFKEQGDLSKGPDAATVIDQLNQIMEKYWGN